jgi:hypothetical protein
MRTLLRTRGTSVGMDYKSPIRYGVSTLTLVSYQSYSAYWFKQKVASRVKFPSLTTSCCATMGSDFRLYIKRAALERISGFFGIAEKQNTYNAPDLNT